MTVPGSTNELAQRNLSVVCPECRDQVTLNPVAGPVRFRDLCYFIGQCPNHKRRHCKPVFAVYENLNDRIVERYPIPSFEADWMDKAIPLGIRQDYSEAKRCNYVEAFKGAVGLFRRVVEAAACDKLGPLTKSTGGKTKKLYDLIDTMHSENLITEDIRKSAHEIRLFGNYGVHIQDDGLDEVTSDESGDVAEITWQLLYTLYVAPAKTAGLRRKRVAKKT